MLQNMACSPAARRGTVLFAILVAGAMTSACSDTARDFLAESPESSTVTAVPKPERELIRPGVALSSAAIHDDLVWTSGHLPDGVSPDAPIEDQVNQVLDNLEATLGQANAGFDTLLKTNVYLLDWADWEAFNQIYEERIGRLYLAPPRTTVDVDHIGLDYRIEIEMVAYIRQA